MRPSRSTSRWSRPTTAVRPSGLSGRPSGSRSPTLRRARLPGFCRVRLPAAALRRTPVPAAGLPRAGARHRVRIGLRRRVRVPRGRTIQTFRTTCRPATATPNPPSPSSAVPPPKQPSYVARTPTAEASAPRAALRRVGRRRMDRQPPRHPAGPPRRQLGRHRRAGRGRRGGRGLHPVALLRRRAVQPVQHRLRAVRRRPEGRRCHRRPVHRRRDSDAGQEIQRNGEPGRRQLRRVGRQTGRIRPGDQRLRRYLARGAGRTPGACGFPAARSPRPASRRWQARKPSTTVARWSARRSCWRSAPSSKALLRSRTGEPCLACKATPTH